MNSRYIVKNDNKNTKKVLTNGEMFDKMPKSLVRAVLKKAKLRVRYKSDTEWYSSLKTK